MSEERPALPPVKQAFLDARTLFEQAEIRPLTADDAPVYRALRQKVLDIGDGGFYSDSFLRESQLLSEEQWRDWCTEKRSHCIVGTFVNKKLVGFTMITQQGPSHSPLVEVEATWYERELRGTGLAMHAYCKAVLPWIISQGYQFAVGFIKDNNLPSLKFRMNQGFVFAYTIKDETWADGSVADTHAFLLDLRPAEQRKRSLPLQVVGSFLSQGWHPPSGQLREERPADMPAHLKPGAPRSTDG